jgi:hypothetical protein
MREPQALRTAGFFMSTASEVVLQGIGASGLPLRAVIEKMAGMQMVDVHRRRSPYRPRTTAAAASAFV